MQLIVYLIALRLRQGFRWLAEINLVRSIILMVIIFIAGVKTFYGLENKPYPFSAVMLVLVFLLHSSRNDKSFLRKLPVNPHWIYFSEYHILLLPWYAALVFYADWVLLACTILAVSVLSCIHLNIRRIKLYTVKIGTFLPPAAFEWKSGLRRNPWIFLVYAAALVFYQSPWIMVLMIIFFTFLSTTFYNDNESKEMLAAFHVSPKEFLWIKSKYQLLIFWGLSTPLLALYLIFTMKYWYVLVVVILVCSIIQLLSIYLKYALYVQGIRTDKNVFIGIYVLSLLIPFFVPVPLVMMVRFYRRAIVNLKFYLNANS